MWIIGVGGWLTATLGLCWWAMTFSNITAVGTKRPMPMDYIWLWKTINGRIFETEMVCLTASQFFSPLLSSVFSSCGYTKCPRNEDTWAVWRCKAWCNIVGGVWKWNKTYFVHSCPQCFLGADLKMPVPWQSWDIVLKKSHYKSRAGPWLRPSWSFHLWVLWNKTQLTISWRQMIWQCLWSWAELQTSTQFHKHQGKSMQMIKRIWSVAFLGHPQNSSTIFQIVGLMKLAG